MVLVQGLMRAVLLRERRLLFVDEVEARQRMSELAHMNRRATAGERSVSPAHELNQPLADILINTEPAQQIYRIWHPTSARSGAPLTTSAVTVSEPLKSSAGCEPS
ncbi:hypothetical protein [Bradyrhizobium sp. NBAIM03]|uniref:hypothetical protein n=1 Tax=Bradyrhizobium sp. NBAIM03 TaxID=2793816 RepID=UPI001CD58FD1|nr:hypothetical protein [Bradyrhizobium sp. NBAIM03]